MSVSSYSRRLVEKVIETALVRCKDSCGFSEDPENTGSYVYTHYADYRDEVSVDRIPSYLEYDYPVDGVYEDLFESYVHYDGEIKAQINQATEAEIRDSLTGEQLGKLEFDYDLENEIAGYLDEHLYFEYPVDHYLNQDVYVNLTVDTGDGNHDFTLNELGDDQTLHEESSLLWLIRQQGFKPQELYAYQAGQLPGASEFIKSVAEEIDNNPSSMGMLTFLLKLTLRELLEFHSKGREKKILTIEPGTTCGLFNPYSGGGSMLGIQLAKPVRISEDLVQIRPDSKDYFGYTVEEVYGMCRSAWTDTLLEQ
jgi:hypothetical protein